MLIPIFLLMFLILTNKDSFQKYFSQDVLNKLSISNKYMGKTTRNILFFLSLILMTIALSRPVVNEKEQSFKQEVNSIVVAIDVSKSMLANDIYPNRLNLAKHKLLEIIDESKQNAIAVILFAKSSFILSPATQDFNSLKILVENLNVGINFDNGSNIFSTLESTQKLLKNYKNKNLILLTDGGNNKDFEKEIKYANEHKINVYTIAIASNKASAIKLENGEFMTKEDGSIVTVSLNESIKNLSLNTNGGYINYSLDNSDLKQILEDIEIKSKKQELQSKKFKTYTELFYYPLGLAILILFIAFSSMPKFFNKKGINIFLLVLSLNSLNKLYAFEFDFKTINKANNAYENEDYKLASKNFEKLLNTPEGKYNFANSLYKQKKYDKALKTYKEISSLNDDLEFKKLHNMGNSYVKTNNLQNAKKMYEKALEIKEDKQTRENLDIVNKALEKDKQKNKNNQEKEQKQEKQEKQEKEEKQQEQKNENESKDENEKNQEQKNKENLEKGNKSQSKEEKISEKEISNLEEKKWLEKIQNQKTPVLLKRVETKSEDNSSNPW